MSITKILTQKDADPVEQLSAVAELVAKARANYKNEDQEIEAGRVNTAYGNVKFSDLEPEGQVAVLRDEAMRIKATVLQEVENTPGTSTASEIEKAIAINPLFTNISTESASEYL